jgi:hypothetical protein
MWTTSAGYNVRFQPLISSQVLLYNATGNAVMANGTIAPGGGASFTVTHLMGASNGGNTFIVNVKYDAKSIVGNMTPANLGLATTQTHSFTTSVNGTLNDSDTATLDLKLAG